MPLVPRWLWWRGGRYVQVVLAAAALLLTVAAVQRWRRASRLHDGGGGVEATALAIRADVMKVDDPSAPYKGLGKRDWTDYAAMEADKKRQGPGEQGQAVHVPDDADTKQKQDQLYRVNGYDALASDMIALDRSVKDIRHPNCKSKKYLEKLPTVSVIFPFHNEHNSTLLRSVHSIINRSPKGTLVQVVLVDDASTKDFLKEPLEQYFRLVKLDHMVTVVRCKKREGLIRARQVGARAATGDVMVFLDAHSEAGYNWLPPLLEPIAENWKTVVCPFVDVVDCDSFEYKPQDEGARGSFDWEFNYKRLPRTDHHADPSDPFDSPVMAGGYFAINRKWFWELGGYDEGLDIWGGEQYELSFKVWQCHGRMVDAPCSRVGHIYRCKYVPFPNPNVGDFISRNYKRVAEVWMDEYKEHLYKRRTSIPGTDPGDLTKQKAVREKLQCKSFKWFIENVAYDQDKFYPAVEPPDGANGAIKSAAYPEWCVDTQNKNKDERFGVERCHGQGGEQALRLSFWKDIRPVTRSMCWDVSTSVRQAPIVMFPCHGMQGNQHFRYLRDTLQIFHPVSHQCLEFDKDTTLLYMSRCDQSVDTQRWNWDNVDWKVIDGWKDR